MPWYNLVVRYNLCYFGLDSDICILLLTYTKVKKTILAGDEKVVLLDKVAQRDMLSLATAYYQKIQKLNSEFFFKTIHSGVFVSKPTVF